jgi:transposase
MGKLLSTEDREYLESSLRQESNRRFADKTRTILLFDKGWDYKRIAEALYLDDQTIRNYKELYEEGGIDYLWTVNYKGGPTKMTTEQEAELTEHLAENIYQTTKEIINHLKQKYGITFHPSGLVYTLHRLGFSYKKPKRTPGKCSEEKQRTFLELYNKLKAEKAAGDPIYFSDSVHPQHNSIAAYGWIKKGVKKQLQSNTGRFHLNLNGALNIETKEVVIQDCEWINGQTILDLCKTLEAKHPTASAVYVILDNARYNRAKLVQDYLKTSKVKLIYLPPYAPNLNIIERLWLFFQKKILYNRYYVSFDEFRQVCLRFFQNLPDYRAELDSLLTENFQIITPSFSKS